MSLKKGLLFGCLGLTLLAFLCGALAVAWFMKVVKDPEGVVVAVEVPLTVAVDQEFDLVVSVTNERLKKPFKLTDIDIGEAYLDGFAVVKTEPAAKSVQQIPIDNSSSFTFDLTIPPDQTRAFVFKLKAVREGFYRGDVDVCEGSQFITTMAQTDVRKQ